MPTWNICLFGGFALRRKGELLPPLHSRKGNQLFVYLALQLGRPALREKLADVFWPAPDPDLARNSLRQTLTHLHKWLGDFDDPLLEANRLAVTLADRDARCDLVDFYRALALAKGAPEPGRSIFHLRQALELAHRPLVPEISGEWLDAERTHCHEALVKAHLALARLLMASGQAREAVAIAQKAVDIEPLREEATQLVMEIAQQADMQSIGLQAYQALASLSFAELGIAPSPELEDLAKELRVMMSPAPKILSSEPEVASHLPKPPWRLLGREAENETLLQALAPATDLGASPRMVTLVGLGGIGKSHLAMHIARGLVPAYQGSVWFVSLQQAGVGEVEKRVADAVLSADPKVHQTRLEGIATALEGRPALLILDNAEEHLSEVKALIGYLCAKNDLVKVLVTSRIPLGLAGEIEAPLSALDTPALDENPNSNACVQLYYLQMRRLSLKSGKTKPAPSEIADLCRALDGIPLAIVLAASMSRSQTPREIMASIGMFRAQSKGEALGRHEQRLTVFDCVAWSCARLGSALPTLQYLSCFVGGATALALQTILPEQNVAVDLDRLIGLSLIQAEEGAQGLRFFMLESVRQYVVAQMSADEMDKVKSAHAAYFEVFIQEKRAEFLNGRQVEVISAIAAEEDNGLAALRYYASSDFEKAVQMASALMPYWRARGRFVEASSIASSLLEAGEEMVSEADLELLRYGLAMMQAELGLYQDSLANVLACIEFSERSKDDLRLAEALNGLGNLQLVYGDDVDSSIESLQHAYKLFEKMGSTQGIAKAALNLGRAFYHGECIDLAIEWLERSLYISRQMGFAIWEVSCLRELAEIALDTNELKIAASHLGCAKELLESLQYKTSNDVFVLLSDLKEREGCIGEAYIYLSEAITLARQTTIPADIKSALRRAVGLFLSQGYWREATRCAGLEEALRAKSGLSLPRPERQKLSAHISLLQEALGTEFREEFLLGRYWALDPALDWIESLLNKERVAARPA